MYGLIQSGSLQLCADLIFLLYRLGEEKFNKNVELPLYSSHW